jgi:hypothetical protein
LVSQVLEDEVVVLYTLYLGNCQGQ